MTVSGAYSSTPNSFLPEPPLGRQSVIVGFSAVFPPPRISKKLRSPREGLRIARFAILRTVPIWNRSEADGDTDNDHDQDPVRADRPRAAYAPCVVLRMFGRGRDGSPPDTGRRGGSGPGGSSMGRA